jgi:hypothetical protein
VLGESTGAGLSDQVEAASENPRLSIDEKRMGRVRALPVRSTGLIVAVMKTLAYSQVHPPDAPGHHAG